MKLTKQKIVMVINEVVDHYDIKSKGFGNWIQRIGAIDDYPDFDVEAWNKIGDLLTNEYEDNRKQGYEILDSFGFEDWDGLQDILSSWNQAIAAQGMKTHSLDPGDPLYDSSYDSGDYDGDISRMVSHDEAHKYLEKLREKLIPLQKEHNLFMPETWGFASTPADPTLYVMLKKPMIGWQIVHFGGGSGPPRVYPHAVMDGKSTSREFAEWFFENFDETELTGKIEKDTKMIIGLIKRILKYRNVNSPLKQMLFLKKPEMASKILGAASAIGLEE